MLHTDNIENITLNNVFIGHVLNCLEDKTEKSMADVGVDRVCEGAVDGRSEVDLLKKIVTGARDCSWETRAVRSFAFGDGRKTQWSPRFRTNNTEILSHYSS